jgi:glycosyltransferase involved in cell wall biosynthesis
MRVLHVMARLPGSGTERQLVGMLAAAHPELWDATLCVLYPGQPLVPEVRDLGVPVLELAGGPASAGRVTALRRLIGSGDYDVVHSSLWGGNAFTRAVASTVRHRPAVVASERRVEDFRGRDRRVIDYALRRSTEAYIGNSQDVVDFVVRAHRVPPSRITVIRNGMDVGVFRPDGPTDDRGPAPVRIGAVGRLVEQKGFDVLIRALPTLTASLDVEVVVLGEGPDRAALEEQARGLPIRFPGAVATPAEVASFLRSLDVFVMPSRYEGLPNALLEAAACGIPVVATDVPGCVEAGDAVTRLVPVEDADALATAVLDVVAGGEQQAGGGVSTFREVAEAHLRVFEQARRDRQAVLGRRS